MGDLLQQALTPENLDTAWRLLRHDKAIWSPGLPRPAMERNLLKHLLELREDVLNKHYKPSGLRQFTLQKANGKQRVITALNLRDKLLQRAVLEVLDPIAERLFHVDSYAYRRGRGVQGAVAKAKERIRCGQDWLVDADIQTFFDSIPIEPLKKRLKKFINDKDILHLITLWLDMGASQQSLFGKARGIPQGAILSPLLCNLYLHEFDQKMHQAHIPFVRYADDFLLFTPNKAAAHKSLELAEKTLHKLDLKMHPDKTQITQSGPHVKFLGQVLPRNKQIAKTKYKTK